MNREQMLLTVQSMTVEQKRSLVQQWIEALRSGDYRQGQDVLRLMSDDDPDGYHCCLGVLSELIDSDGWRPPEWAIRGDGALNLPTSMYWHKDDELPNRSVMTYLVNPLANQIQSIGFRTIVQGVNPIEPPEELTFQWLNDKAKLSFNQIADLLEAALDDVFPAVMTDTVKENA